MVELLPVALARLEQGRAGLAKWGLFPEDEPVRYIKAKISHEPDKKRYTRKKRDED